MRLRLALPVAAVAGLALNLAYQPTGWWPMALVGVGLSLATLVGRSVGAALLVGVVFGAVFYGLHLAWVGQFLGPIRVSHCPVSKPSSPQQEPCRSSSPIGGRPGGRADQRHS